MRLQSGMNSERQHRWCRRIANLKGGLMPRRWLTQASGGITTRFELSILPRPHKAQCLLGFYLNQQSKVYASRVRMKSPTLTILCV